MNLHKKARRTFYNITLITVLLFVFASSLLLGYFAIHKTYELSLQQKAKWEEIVKYTNYIATHQFGSSASRRMLDSIKTNLANALEEEAELNAAVNSDTQSIQRIFYRLFLDDEEIATLDKADADPDVHDLIGKLSRMPASMFSIGTRHWDAATHLAIKSGNVYVPVTARSSALLKLLQNSVRALWVMLVISAVMYWIGIYLIWKKQLGRALDGIESAQQELEEQRNLQRLVLDNLPASVNSVDENKEIVFSNRGYKQLFGIPDSDSLYGMQLETLVGEENWKRIFPFVSKAMNGNQVEFEVNITTADGPKVVQEKYVPVQQSGVDNIRFISLSSDITSHKLMENNLRKSEQHLRITLDSIGDGVIATDRDNRIVTLNPVAERLTGHSLKFAKGKLLDEIFNLKKKQDEEIVNNPDYQHPRLISELGVDGKLISASGEKYLISINMSPIQNLDGKVEGTVVVFRDLTQEKEHQKVVVHNEKMQALGVLAGGIAHDFNNMLGGILGATELVISREAGNISPKSKELLNRVFRTSEQAADLTKKLTRFSRTDNPSDEKMDLTTVLDDSLHFVKCSIDKRIEIKSEMLAGNTCVQGNASSLQAAFLNVLLNAVQSMSTGGVLSINTRNITIDVGDYQVLSQGMSPGEYVEIKIQDTGVGIPKENMNKIFQPFFTTKEKGRGTGLGLSAVYGTIASHKGSIVVESQEGVGSTFIVMLPVSEESESRTVVEPLQEKVVERNNTILYIDDDHLLLEVTKAQLARFGYNVVVADNGYEGIEKFRDIKNQILAVLLDINMPEINGVDTYRALREIDENCRVIMVTGFVDKDLAKSLKKNENLPVIKKPFKIETLRKLFHAVGVNS